MQTITQTGAFMAETRDIINRNFAEAGIITQGNVFWVKPGTGYDGNDGLSPTTAFKTLQAALGRAKANQNDVVLLCGQSNTSADTTDYQTVTLDWNKDLVHLIGINSGPLLSQRSRVALVSTYDTASNLFTVSADGCLIANIQFFEGVAGTAPTGCVKVTGSRNVFNNVHFAGIGNDANDIAGAYSLFLDGASECVFNDCAIGLDTIARGTAANSEILIDGGASRNSFNRCLIFAMLEHATNHPLVKLADATAIDRFLRFTNCEFINESVNYAVAQAGNFKLVQALTQGFITLNNPYTNSSDNSTAIKWDADDRNQIALFNAPTPAADTAGCARMV